MTRLRHLIAHTLMAIAELLDPVEPFFGDEDAEPTPTEWGALAVLHAEAVHGCDHTESIRRGIGMAGPRGEPA